VEGGSFVEMRGKLIEADALFSMMRVIFISFFSFFFFELEKLEQEASSKRHWKACVCVCPSSPLLRAKQMAEAGQATTTRAPGLGGMEATVEKVCFVLMREEKTPMLLARPSLNRT